MENQKVKTVSADVSGEKLSELRRLFPEAWSENKIDWEKLRGLFDEAGALSGAPTSATGYGAAMEKYGLNWAGRSNAFLAIRTPATGTFAPMKNESVKWDETKNIFVEGDNLEVLKLLQMHYREKIKMIYIDPPYNTGKDFVYKDNFTESVADYYERTGQTEGGIKMTANTEKNGRYHSDWLTMMYPRLFLAKNLLREDGVIFVSIDDNEVANLRMILDEIFGEENFVATFPWKKRTAKSDVPFGVSQDFEWILCYAKESFIAGLAQERKYYQTDDFPNDRWRLSDLTKQTSASERPNSAFDLIDPKTKKSYPFNPKRTWSITQETFQEYYDKGKIVFPDDYDFLRITIPAYRVFESEDKEKALKKYGTEDQIKAASTQLPKDIGMNEDGNKEMEELFGGKPFSFPKPTSLIKYLLDIVNNKDDNDIILDFFAGSGTTAHAVMDLNAEDGGNRKWICVQLPETTDETSEAYKAGYKTIAEISRERIRRAGSAVAKAMADKAKTDKIDLGFKSFKLSPSNYRIWREITSEDDPEILLAQSKLFAEKPLMDGYEKQNVVQEISLKEGYDLNAKMEQTGDIWTITDGEKKLVITFAEKVTKPDVEKLGLQKTDTFVCFDNALDDTAKINIARSFNLKAM
jgi:adenine-specific DNA-methyltransferase